MGFDRRKTSLQKANGGRQVIDRFAADVPSVDLEIGGCSQRDEMSRGERSGEKISEVRKYWHRKGHFNINNEDGLLCLPIVFQYCAWLISFFLARTDESELRAFHDPCNVLTALTATNFDWPHIFIRL